MNNGATVLTKFTADTRDFDNGVKKVDASVGSIAKGNIVATAATKAFSAAWGLVSQNMDKAIDRFDTLNSFSTVMENLGIDANESQEAIDKMADKLQGLPTTLQDGASAVQRFTAANGDVKKSTNYFLALNNAILAGKAPLVNQQAALEQLTQAYSRGKFEANEWKSLLIAMPAQMNQLAQAFGYTSTAIGNDFYNAIAENKVPMDELMDKMVELNEKGGANFKSWETQARTATGGVRTALEVMNGRISQGIEKMIRAINDGLKDAGLGDISTILINVGNTIKQALISLAPYIVKIISLLSALFGWISKNKEMLLTLAKVIVPVVAAIKLYNTYIAIQNALLKLNATTAIFTKTAQLAQAAATKVVTAAQWLLNVAMSANPITWIIIAIVALIAIFVLLWNKCEGFRNFWIGLWEWIVNAAQGAWEWIKGAVGGIVSAIQTGWNFIKGIFDTVIGFIKNNWQTILLFILNPFAGAFKLIYDHCEPFRNFVNNFINGIVTWVKGFYEKVKSIVTSVVKFVLSIPEKIASVPGKIIDFFKSLPSRMLNIGLDIVKGIGKGITNGITWIKNIITGFVGNVMKFIKKLFKIGSPSKLMENQIGQWIPKGIAVGISANTDAVNKSMENMQKELSHTFQLSPQVANSAALHYSPTVISNVNVNMTQDPLGQMVRDVKTFSGGSKNDYNYGMGV